MKNLLLKNVYTKGISAGILIMLIPMVLWLISLLPSLIYPNDCDIYGQCQHAIVDFSSSLGFGLLIFGLPMLLLGAFLTLLFIFLYGVHTLRQRDVANYNFAYVKIMLGVLAGIVIMYALYIPAGPDECSRAIIAAQYTNCLEKQFSGMTEAEVREWLEKRGYETAPNYERRGWGTFGQEKFAELNVENYFEASKRSYDRPKSLPYGTNFARWVLPMFPAPARFTIGIGIDESTIGRYHIHPDWSFEFL